MHPVNRGAPPLEFATEDRDRRSFVEGFMGLGHQDLRVDNRDRGRLRAR